MQPSRLKFTLFILLPSLTIFSFAQNNIVSPQYTDSNGNFIVTCPGVLGTIKPPELLTSTIGILFNKPRVIKNPRVPESCYTNQYLECGDIGTSFMCDRNGQFDACPLIPSLSA